MSSTSTRTFLPTTAKLLVGSALAAALLFGAGGVTTAGGHGGGLHAQAAPAPGAFEWNSATTGSVPPPPQNSLH